MRLAVVSVRSVNRYTFRAVSTSIIAITISFAGLVLIENLPECALRETLSPVLNPLEGPELRQGWSLFAPNPGAVSQHVLVRARNKRGEETAWYDASQFFIDERRRNLFTPLWALSEGLDHGSGFLDSKDLAKRRQAKAEVERTSLMVIARAVPHFDIFKIQIELQRHSITLPHQQPKKGSQNIRYDWIRAMPVPPL